MDSPAIPADGPDGALVRVSERLKLPYSRSYIARAVASHPRPTSLLALVEVATDLGVKATPAQTEASELDAFDLPLIVHFNGSEGGGFGVLEAVTPNGFKVWDSVNGARVLDRGVFTSSWSGIVAMLERIPNGGVKEPNYLRNRFVERVFGRLEPPAFVGSRAATFLRVTFAALVVCLLALAVEEVPSRDRVVAAAVILLSVLGLLVTVVTSVSIGSQNSLLADRVCARGKLVDCHSVLSSRYSRIFGMPLSDIGIAFFGGLVLVLVTGALGVGGWGIWTAVGVAFLASVPFSLILIGTQVAMRQLCTLCLAVHLVNFSGATITWVWLKPLERVPDNVTPILLFALYFGMVLFFVIPYFKKHQGLAVLAGMHRRISSSPFASLAEIVTSRPIDLDPRSCGVALTGTVSQHELVVFVHPTCAKCQSALGMIQALGQSGMVATFIGLAPKDPTEGDRRGCSAVVAAGLALSPDRIFDAYAAAKKNLRTFMSGDAVGMLARELSAPAATIESELVTARRMVERAETIADEHAEGTPAIFFNSRPYSGPLEHLAYLLEKHPDLLAPTRVDRGASARAQQEVSPS